MTDAAIVAGIRSGDESSLAQLYDRYSRVVYSVALRVIGDTGFAEDILQEIFLQLWKNPGAFDASRGNLGPWLSVIARNRAIDAIRKRKPQDDIEDVVLSVSTNFEEELDRNRSGAKVRAALAEMPPAQKKALELAYFEGMSHTEIAAKTGEPLGTIKTRIRSGLISLRSVLAT